MDKKKKKTELRDVIREEGSRGARHPITLDAMRLARERSALLNQLLELSTEEEFVEAIRAYGLVEGSEPFLVALDAWHEHESRS
jgi:hypothetical protein